MPAFEVCMEAKTNKERAILTLKDCNNTAVQKSNFSSENQIKVSGKYEWQLSKAIRGKAVVERHLFNSKGGLRQNLNTQLGKSDK